MKEINLPVSLGEALDKLTILEIKLEKINDNRKIDVQKEHDILYDKLKLYIQKFSFYYKILKQTNLDIWEMQDDFRYNNGDKTKLCFKIIEDNDRRFRIKKKINDAANSSLKEQKGYVIRKAFFLSHLGLGDNINMIGAVRYLSTLYDNVYVVCKAKYKKNVELIYNDDKSIIIYPVNNDNDISPRYGCDISKFKQITDGMEIHLCGNHLLDKKSNNLLNIPCSFYADLNIDFKYFYKYFHINETEKSKNLFNEIKDLKYIFMHNTTSYGKLFDVNDIERHFNIDKQKVLIINPNKNIYHAEDRYFHYAEKFVWLPLPDYIDTIINSQVVVVSDSSFLCMCFNLPIKTNKKYYISRGNHNYDYIYENNNNIKKFEQLIIN